MNDAEIRRFVLAAQQHLQAAGILLKNRCNRVSQYLAGLSVECALKAALLSRVPTYERKQFVQREFRGTRWHSYDTILQSWRQKGGSPPPTWARDLRRLRTWTIEMRYQTDPV